MTKKLILLLIVCARLFYSVSYAQSIADINSPKILPPFPDAAALGKYAQIPVDKSTGIPSISIPLYEIKTSRFTLPISLSYHASGVKVDETASWVGLGWSLNAGGVVSRSIIGVADDGPAGFLNIPIPTAQTLFNNFHADSLYMENVASNISDSQPDNFFYNFANQSGAFVFDAVTKAPILIPYKPLKIAFTPGTLTAASAFTILDEQGNLFYFNDTEISYSGATNGATGITSWYLSKMISADKSDTVKFSYTQDPAIFTDNSYSFSQNIGPLGANGALWNLVSTTNTSHGTQIHLSSIQFRGGKVDFISKTGRKDNGQVSLDSVIVSNYDYNLKKYNRLKSFNMIAGYFHTTIPNPPLPYNANHDSLSMYRLRLDGVSENDQNKVSIKTHSFIYNSTMLPPLHNFGQDTWGYYNGVWSNQTLLRTQQVVSSNGNQATGSQQNVVYTIAGGGLGADRSVSPTSMQAGILQQITYPTKGYSVFTYEPNQYIAPAVTTVAPSATSVGVFQDTSFVSFTPAFANPAQTSGQLIFHIHITKNVQTSFVRINQGSTNIYTYNGNSTTDVDTDVPLTVTAGVTYQLMAVSYDSIDKTIVSTLPVSAISTTFSVTGAPVLNNVGGLRIRYIKNYDNTGAAISTETYKYGNGESGGGVFLSSSSLLVQESQHYYQFPYGNNGQPSLQTESTFSNSSIYALSSLSGSPVAYDWVTVYHGDTIRNAGKSTYQYTITPDSILSYTEPPINPPTPQTAYDSVTRKYFLGWGTDPDGRGGVNGIKPIPRLWQNGEPIAETHYANNGSGQYTAVQSKTTKYNLFFRSAGRGLFLQFLLEFSGAPRSSYNMYMNSNDFDFYDYPISNGSRLPTQTITTNYGTDGTALTDTTKYYYNNLSHMYPTSIRSYNGKGDSLLKQVKYPQDMVAAGLDPTGIYAAMVSANIISPVIQFTDSKNGTQMEQSVTNYASTSGIINPSTVSLQVMANTAETRLNYQKYDSGNGNLLTVSKQGGPPVSYIWGYNGEYPVAEVKNALAKNIFYESFEDGNGNSTGNDAKSGFYSHTGTYSKTLGSITPLDNGSYMLTYWQKSGSAWSFVSNPVTVSGGTYPITLSGQVDDIRFYPANALMTTYTYDPTVGVTSVTDAKNQVTYYEYDSFLRLLNIKDKDGNIVKSFCYNYAGQATGCSVNPLLPPPTPTYAFTLTNSTGVSGFVAAFSGGVGNFNFPATGSTTVNVPAGSYTVTINPVNGPVNRKFLLGARAPITAPGYAFTNVIVAPTGTETPLIIQNP